MKSSKEPEPSVPGDLLPDGMSSDGQYDELSEMESTENHHTTRDLAKIVYEELRTLAHHYRQKHARRDQPMQTTAVVHEAYLRLSKTHKQKWESKEEFLAVAATAVRHLLIDVARKKQAIKRGGGQSLRSFDEVEFVLPDTGVDLLELNDCLMKLMKLNPLHARIVELRFFGGMTASQTAKALGISESHVHKQWKWAKAWLRNELGTGSDVDNRKQPDDA